MNILCLQSQPTKSDHNIWHSSLISQCTRNGYIKAIYFILLKIQDIYRLQYIIRQRCGKERGANRLANEKENQHTRQMQCRTLHLPVRGAPPV